MSDAGPEVRFDGWLRLDDEEAAAARRVGEGDRLVIVLRDTGWVSEGENDRYPLLDELNAELRRVGLFERTMVIVASNPADEIHVVRGGA